MKKLHKTTRFFLWYFIRWNKKKLPQEFFLGAWFLSYRKKSESKTSLRVCVCFFYSSFFFPFNFNQFFIFQTCFSLLPWILIMIQLKKQKSEMNVIWKHILNKQLKAIIKFNILNLHVLIFFLFERKHILLSFVNDMLALHSLLIVAVYILWAILVFKSIGKIIFFITITVCMQIVEEHKIRTLYDKSGVLYKL